VIITCDGTVRYQSYIHSCSNGQGRRPYEKGVCSRVGSIPSVSQMQNSSNGPARVQRWRQREAPSKPLAVDNPLLLPDREVSVEIGITWSLDQDIPSHCESKRRVRQNPGRAVTLGRTPWQKKDKIYRRAHYMHAAAQGVDNRELFTKSMVGLRT